MKRWLAIAGLFIAAAAMAQVDLRTIPADTRRGQVRAIELGAVNIDGKVLRMAPGARILSAENMTITPNQMAAGTLVRYQIDGVGQIRTIWILTPAEARR